MKPIDILDALSDLPEEYAAFAVQRAASPDAAEPAQKAQSAQEGIVVNMQEKIIKKRSPLPFGRAGIAAAIAVCIGLNAALIYGIGKVRTANSAAPGSAVSTVTADPKQDRTVPYMEVKDAVPTGVQLEMHNPTDAEIGVSGRFAVYQDGAKVADCEVGATDAVRVPANDCRSYTVNFPQLPAGSYTLYELTADGSAPNQFGGVDFEISAEYDSMVWIPGAGLTGMQYEEAKALLEEKGVTVSKAAWKFLLDGREYEVGEVASVSVQPFKTEELIYTTRPYYHTDGRGYWVKPGEKVTLSVYIGEQGDPSTVPDAEGADFEESQEVIWAEGFAIEKHYAYDADVPEGRIISIEPKPGTELPIGEMLRVTVSLGAKMDTVKIPDLTNMPLKFAKREIEERELVFELCHISDPYTRAGDTSKTEPPAGTAVAIGETVRVYISTGDPNDTVYVPDFKDMQWELAKEIAEELGIMLAKQQVNPNSAASVGTVQSQSVSAGEEVPVGSVVLCDVVIDPKEPDTDITVSMPEGHTGRYYVYVRNEQLEVLGCSLVFSAEAFASDGQPGFTAMRGLTVDRTDEGAIVEAVLVNYETKQEAVIGRYRLHQAPEAYSEAWKTYKPFDVISEDTEDAFRQVEP